jgi:hypothetical protein
MSNETLARDLYISTQMQLRFPQLPSSAYGAALEQEIRRRGPTLAMQPGGGRIPRLLLARPEWSHYRCFRERMPVLFG